MSELIVSNNMEGPYLSERTKCISHTSQYYEDILFLVIFPFLGYFRSLSVISYSTEAGSCPLDQYELDSNRFVAIGKLLILTKLCFLINKTEITPTSWVYLMDNMK